MLHDSLSYLELLCPQSPLPQRRVWLARLPREAHKQWLRPRALEPHRKYLPLWPPQLDKTENKDKTSAYGQVDKSSWLGQFGPAKLDKMDKISPYKVGINLRHSLTSPKGGRIRGNPLYLTDGYSKHCILLVESRMDMVATLGSSSIDPSRGLSLTTNSSESSTTSSGAIGMEMVAVGSWTSLSKEMKVKKKGQEDPRPEHSKK